MFPFDPRDNIENLWFPDVLSRIRREQWKELFGLPGVRRSANVWVTWKAAVLGFQTFLISKDPKIKNGFYWKKSFPCKIASVNVNINLESTFFKRVNAW